MSKTTIWLHGSAATPRYPDSFPTVAPPGQNLFLERSSGGLTVSPPIEGIHDFHLVLPAPTLLDDYFMRLRSLTVLFAASDATIDQVDLHNGPAVVTFPLGWTGQHLVADGTNVLHFAPPLDLSSGMLMAMQVSFGVASHPEQGHLTGSLQLAGVGAAFETSESFGERLIRLIASVFSPN